MDKIKTAVLAVYLLLMLVSVVEWKRGSRIIVKRAVTALKVRQPEWQTVREIPKTSPRSSPFFESSRVFEVDLRDVGPEMNPLMPTQIGIYVCNSAVVSYQPFAALCEVKNRTILENVPWIQKDIVVGHYPPFNVFQHDMINGLPQSGLMVDYVLKNTTSRAFVCSPLICKILRAVVPEEALLDMRRLPKKFSAPSLRIAHPNWHCRDCIGDSYPIGSFWPVKVFLNNLNLTVPRKPFEVLFLSRGGSGRRIENENLLISCLKELVGKLGGTLNVIGHHKGVTDPSRIEAFYRASIVLGLHGGLFSNIAFCHSNVTIIEINNVNFSRDCFLAMARSLELDYVKFQPSSHFIYQSEKCPIGDQKCLTPVVLYERDISRLKTLVCTKLREKGIILPSQKCVGV